MRRGNTIHETDAESEYMILILDVSDGIDKEFCKFKNNRGQGVLTERFHFLFLLRMQRHGEGI